MDLENEVKLGISAVWQLHIHYESLAGVSVMLLCTWKQFSSSRDSVGTVTNARKYICDATREKRGIWRLVIRAGSQKSPWTAQRKSKVASLSLLMGEKRRKSIQLSDNTGELGMFGGCVLGTLRGVGSCGTGPGLAPWGIWALQGCGRAEDTLGVPDECRDWLAPQGCVLCHCVCHTSARLSGPAWRCHRLCFSSGCINPISEWFPIQSCFPTTKGTNKLLEFSVK